MVVSRRRFLGSAAAASGTAAGLVSVSSSGRVEDPGAPAAGMGDCGPANSEVVVRPGDPRYAQLMSRGFNRRYVGSPETVRLVYSAGQVEQAINEATRAKKRITARSGGHCLDALVDDPRFQVLVDVSEMKRVYFDSTMKAFAVESGAMLAEVYRALYLGWGVTLPAGICPKVGVGGHVAGGGYGALSRRLGLSIDHLYAVEVVVADESGRARTVVATRREDDPNRDLWWAHTGGGGGNFGIVTKYWFRTPGATSNSPADLLPRPPARLLMSWVSWPWEGMTEANFTRLVKNHGEWHAANSEPGSPFEKMHSSLHLNTQKEQAIFLETRWDATLPNAQRMLDDYISAVGRGVTVKPVVNTTDQLWLRNTLYEYEFAESPSNRGKSKGSHLRKPLTEGQIHTIYQGLTDPSYKGLCLVYLASYGGQINTVAPHATAIPQRDSIFKFWISGTWADPAQDEESMAFVRKLYRGVHAATGGVPVPNDAQDGCYINYPDIDTKDPAWNTSGVPWHTLCYKDNYPRLQQIKAKYDPGHVFQHALSIEPA